MQHFCCATNLVQWLCKRNNYTYLSSQRDISFVTLRVKISCMLFARRCTKALLVKITSIPWAVRRAVCWGHGAGMMLRPSPTTWHWCWWWYKAQLAWKCLFTPTFFDGRFWPVKYVRLTWFLACHESSLVGLCVQGYQCLRLAVTIRATWSSFRHSDNVLTSLCEKLSQLS